MTDIDALVADTDAQIAQAQADAEARKEAMMLTLMDVLADKEQMARVVAAAVIAEHLLSRTAPNSEARLILWEALCQPEKHKEWRVHGAGGDVKGFAHGATEREAIEKMAAELRVEFPEHSFDDTEDWFAMPAGSDLPT